MRRFGILIILVMTFVEVLGQITNVPGTGNSVQRIQKQYAAVEGSPYLYSDWKIGAVTDKGGKVFSNVVIRYDAYKDWIELDRNGEVLILDSDLYPKFSLTLTKDNSNEVVIREFRNGFRNIPSFSTKNYFEVLNEGKATLLHRLQIEYVEQNISSYGTPSNIKQFQRKERYFLINKDGKAVDIKINKKSVLDAIGDKQVELNSYITYMKLKLNNVENVVELVNFYNTL